MTYPVPPAPSLNSRKLTLLSFIYLLLLLLQLDLLNYCHSLAAILLHFLFHLDNLMRCLSQLIISLYCQKIIYYLPF